MSSGWGCPHDQGGTCTRVKGHACDPGMKGCILAGRFRFSNPDKNRPDKNRPAKPPRPDAPPPDSGGEDAPS